MLKEQFALMQAAEDMGFDSVNVLEASMAKAVAPAAAFEATQLRMELLGEVGARGDHRIEALFCDVKAMDSVEGTGKMQRPVMARQLVNLPSKRSS
ncbi:MAG: hypothetical protein IH800_09005 [Myxococcales bacterium]|nr:hypothetical protein [Myxococcales bacterium]MCZ6822220.1 acyl-CoA dehydrogenase family protein [Deltaproteobacteria bacterium]